jgi:thiol-disulfide isomerase/thioredoxin
MRIPKLPAVLLILLGLFALWQVGKTFLGPVSGPDFSDLTTIHGKPVPKDLADGKWVLVSYVQSWCSECIREMPSIERLQNQVGTEKLAVFLISDEDTARIHRLMRRTTLPIFQSSTGFKRKGIFVYPTTLLLDPKGNLRIKKEEGFAWDSQEVLQLFKL